MKRHGTIPSLGVEYMLVDRDHIRMCEREVWIERGPGMILLGRARFNSADNDACITFDEHLNVGETTVSMDPADPRLEEMIERAVRKWLELRPDAEQKRKAG